MFELSPVISQIIDWCMTLFAAIAGCYITYFIFFVGKKADIARERLDKVYYPLFSAIERDIYKKLPRELCDENIRAIRVIAENGGMLVDPSLLWLVKQYEKSPNCSQKEYQNFKYTFWDGHDYKTPTSYLTYWFDICQHIDQTYDKLCMQCFLPHRDRAYRLNNNQYPNNFRWMLSFLRIQIPYIAVFLMFVFILLATGNALIGI